MPISKSQNSAQLPTKPDIRKSTTVFALSQVLRVVGAFVVSALIARQMGASGKGELALLQQIPTILSIVLGFGLGGTHIYYVGIGKRSVHEALNDTFLITLFSAIVGIPLSMLIASFLPALNETPLHLTALAAALVPLGILTGQLGAIATGAGKPKVQAWATSISLALNLSVVIVLYFLVKLTLFSVLVTAAATSGIGCVVILAALQIGSFRPRQGFLSRTKSALAYTRKHYITEVATLLEMRIDVLFLGALGTSAAVGVYSVGVSFAELLWILPQTIETPLLARFLKEDGETSGAMAAMATRLVVALEGILLLGSLLLLKPILTFFFGPYFTEAVQIFWGLAAGVALNGIASPAMSYLTARGRQFPGVSVFSLVSNTLLCVALIPSLGALGAALASTFSYTCASLYILRVFCKEAHLGWRDIALFSLDDLKRVLPSIKR